MNQDRQIEGERKQKERGKNQDRQKREREVEESTISLSTYRSWYAHTKRERQGEKKYQHKFTT